MATKDRRYNVTLSAKLDDDLTALSEMLGATKSEVMRRALVLFRHAVAADKVKLLIKGEEQTVLVK